MNKLVDSRGSSSDRGAQCKFCSKTGHGYIPPAKTRRRECPASGATCKNCQKRGHLARACRSRRRYVKVITPPIRQVAANYDAQPSDRTSDDDSDDDDDYYQIVQQPLIPQPPPQVQGPPDDPGVGGGLQRDRLPEDLHPLHNGARSPPPPTVGNTIPRRNTRPPNRYVDADYDVSTLMNTDRSSCKTLPRNLVIL